MTPFYFGTKQRRLFGAYTAARVAGSRRAVVICNPWGQEYLRSHRSMNRMAIQLASAGMHVLRFDYFGTGDSAGEMTDASIADWEEDTRTAIEELQATTDARKVHLIGMRLGGWIAARVAASQAANIDSLVLWDPVVSGARYANELMRSSLEQDFPQDLPTVRSPDAGGGFEIMGFPLHARLVDEIAAIDLAEPLGRVRSRTLIAVSKTEQSADWLVERCDAGALGSATVEVVDDEPCWIQQRNLGVGAVPTALIRRVVAWLQ